MTTADSVLVRPRALAVGGLGTVRRHPLILVLAVMVLVFQVSTGSFLDPANLRGIATDAATLAIVAVPLALLVISGYLDLSVGSTLALGGLVAGWLAGQGQSPVVAVLGGLAAGAAVGAVNGVLCCYFGLSAFIVTLGMLTAVRGLAQQLFPLPLSGFGAGFAWLGGSRIAGIAAPVVIAVAVLVAGALFLALTPAGRHVFAIGVNREAAYLSGISVRRTPFALFVVTGVAAALAGAIKASVLDSAVGGTSGAGFELTVLTAVLLGGVALSGGSGSVLGVLLGVLFLGSLQNGLTLLDVPTFWQQMAQGTALVAGAALAHFAPRSAR
ncbi:ABC transporter permease [Streptomyces turgidiscabies]|uniref:Amino acid or sugar ABC transporter, permease protein n=1 Tax=Streptomyces turgidiscabies (strain Car8) TaxID=698760 RepID=L7EQZ1_STRT8|nr:MULTISPECIES: ABC transporter permease [Streptomyces]ELP61452.1 amino acid or sugar ABC transporter, permease protein [Streptomyces turgidiscabies Car8]MDX3491940.1 ABC transporter permease [Streptomyces turgidiscabies]GAQ71943.1 ribose transport system permease protein RbsC [Streptomyces turgidiscabies]